MQNDRRTANVDRDALSLIFERVSSTRSVTCVNTNCSKLHEKVSKRTEDDKHQAERQQRRAIDGLRSYIKHLEPAIRLDDTYEKVLPRIERSEEYLALSSEELRRSAFEKVIRRLKEKDEDAEKDRLKRRERESVEKPLHRDRDRGDRDRGERSHRTSARHTRPSRSPEPDAYEADRRKATADREKNYRKANVADTLLSPGRRSSDRGERLRDPDREREPDRIHRTRREASPPRQDRERRDRDDERDRQYRRRGDPRGSIDDLPYGDEKPSGSRRRRADSDIESAGSRRDSKVRRISEGSDAQS